MDSISPISKQEINKDLAPENAVIYVVSTPIGNLEDMTFRAVSVLKSVELIAAEDTRHSKSLLAYYAINTSCISYHQHNESAVAIKLLSKVKQGQSIALISDAGTPLINDPGYQLIRMAIDSGVRVVPIPGCCALITALSASGLPTDQFAFFGYPPRAQSARRKFFADLAKQHGTLLFYESSHRIKNSLHDIAEIFPETRRLVIARELTKRFEAIQAISVGEISNHFEKNDYAEKGEFVILLDGCSQSNSNAELDMAEEVLVILMQECSLKTAVNLVAKLTGLRKKTIYQLALKLQKNQE